jgi:hypothetical protein
MKSFQPPDKSRIIDAETAPPYFQIPGIQKSKILLIVEPIDQNEAANSQIKLKFITQISRLWWRSG